MSDICTLLFVLAGVKDIDRYHGKLTVSLQPSSLSQSLAKLKLGVISREDLPLHYWYESNNPAESCRRSWFVGSGVIVNITSKLIDGLFLAVVG